ncbi:hypothetical protein FQN51_004212 [Onygenales sp. PD_10]|nr:hypothetical protein FQN51_004212 [Onygenales sp. PD_10]
MPTHVADNNDKEKEKGEENAQTRENDKALGLHLNDNQRGNEEEDNEEESNDEEDSQTQKLAQDKEAPVTPAANNEEGYEQGHKGVGGEAEGHEESNDDNQEDTDEENGQARQDKEAQVTYSNDNKEDHEEDGEVKNNREVNLTEQHKQQAPQSNSTQLGKEDVNSGKPHALGTAAANMQEKSLNPNQLLKWKKEVLYIHHKFQKGFLPPDQSPKEEEMGQIFKYLQKLEEYSYIPASIISSTKIHKDKDSTASHKDKLELTHDNEDESQVKDNNNANANPDKDVTLPHEDKDESKSRDPAKDKDITLPSQNKDSTLPHNNKSGLRDNNEDELCAPSNEDDLQLEDAENAHTNLNKDGTLPHDNKSGLRDDNEDGLCAPSNENNLQLEDAENAHANLDKAHSHLDQDILDEQQVKNNTNFSFIYTSEEPAETNNPETDVPIILNDLALQLGCDPTMFTDKRLDTQGFTVIKSVMDY